MLIGPGKPSWRWRWTRAYPASRLAGRMRKVLLRGLCGLHLLPERKADAEGDFAQEFLEEHGVNNRVCAVWVGVPGASQKWTLFLADENGQVTHYLKVGQVPLAQYRLEKEFKMLKALPEGIGPRALGFGQIGNAKALLLEAVHGQPLQASAGCPDSVTGLASRLVRQESCPFVDHPWVRWLQEKIRLPSETAAPLTSRSWPVNFFHGDFAPWNILRLPGGSLRVLDWEYGMEEGFPFIDLIYYQLQVRALVYRRGPAEAFREVHMWLKSCVPDLKEDEARALIRLAGWYGVWQRREDGYDERDFLMNWRKQIAGWKGDTAP
ncbi:MAG TPA: hypothetical protein DEQ80_08265 [Anaerolinea thermolimosa]|uniref:Aminoglycoside phosphotransferase domain-containing protein n=1 Tax=Anaerolinea thermolimosa TaxID=229919 RepID=A0A3D1JGX7_9CHLR|nr:hypothetical protein [Anaerolinea thermolimosa]